MSTSHVNVKTLQQKQFKVPIEPADTIANVKAKIESINGDPVANQKLLFAGKTLADDVPVEQYNLKETDFLVLMISKMRPASDTSLFTAPAGSFAFKPATTASTFTPTSGISPSGFAATPGISTPDFTATPTITIPPSSDRAPSDSVPAPPEPAIQPPTESTATPTTTTSAPEERSGPSLVGIQTAFATGPPSENAIKRLRDLGVPENMIRPALRVAFNSPDRAAELWINGEFSVSTDDGSAGESLQAPSQESTTPSLPTELPSADARDPMHIVTPGVAAESRMSGLSGLGSRPGFSNTASQSGGAGSGLGGLSGLSGLGGMGGMGGLGGMGATSGLGGMGATGGRGMGGMGGLSGMGGMGGLSGMGGMGGMSGLGGMGSRSSPGSRPNAASNSTSVQFSQFRQMVQQHPALLQPFIDRLRTSNPALADMFQRDPEAFLRMLEALDSDNEGGGSGSGTSDGVQAVAVTLEEKEALDRIQEMGFSRNKAIQAYFACDKNEELAINYLLEHGDDD